MYFIREATHQDIDFLTEADLLVGVEDESETTPPLDTLTTQERATHCQKIAGGYCHPLKKASGTGGA